MNIQQISVADDPRVLPYHELRGNAPILEHGRLVLAEGMQAVRCLLGSALPLRSIFFEPKYRDELVPLLALRDLRDTEVFCADRQVMSGIVGYRLHRGLMALADRPQFVEVAELETPVVALDRLADSENVGAIVRSAYAFGVRSLLVDESTCDPFVRRAVRVSMGASLLTRTARTVSLEEALEGLGRRAEVVAVELVPGSESVAAARFTKDSVFVFGSELDGIRPEILRAANRVVCIPLEAGPIPSLNVAAAAAIVLAKYFACVQS